MNMEQYFEVKGLLVITLNLRSTDPQMQETFETLMKNFEGRGYIKQWNNE